MVFQSVGFVWMVVSFLYSTLAMPPSTSSALALTAVLAVGAPASRLRSLCRTRAEATCLRRSRRDAHHRCPRHGRPGTHDSRGQPRCREPLPLRRSPRPRGSRKGGTDGQHHAFCIDTLHTNESDVVPYLEDARMGPPPENARVVVFRGAIEGPDSQNTWGAHTGAHFFFLFCR